jgi:hypothetical protein
LPSLARERTGGADFLQSPDRDYRARSACTRRSTNARSSAKGTGLKPPKRMERSLEASRWPEFYGNVKDIELEGGGSELRRGARFHWTTFGVRVHTVIEELEPNRRLAWSGRGLGSTAYHGWVLVPKDGGTLVITEETQQGSVASIARWFLRRGLLTWHQRWLEGLARVSEADGGAPNRS